ncbi:AAA family ATPase [Cohnella cellulosilytica]|uniref:AAA family ATPase n=1 Tax=Cohnella cellulosilytica TaxID=986710 RepID=A0ABW2FK74_9BACL
MYIREIEVDGYGALSGLRLALGEGRTTVLYGPNEAGKSTLLRFVRSMLYGFPTRKEPVERGEPVFGGRHGGRLVLADAGGREWRIERHAERSGEIRLRDDSGNERIVGQAEWERLLLGGLSERLFRQLFAVSLNELHELRTLQGEELGNYLYHAGLAGGASITEARRRIGAELDRLYRPKGSNQEMNRLLAGIKELETAIRQSRDGIRDYAETTEELERVGERLARIDEELPALRLESAKLQGALDLREWWLKREALLAEIAEARSVLADPAVPLLSEEAAGSWAELRSRRSAAADRLAAEREALGELRRQRDGLRWDDERLSAFPELERLEAMREGIAAKREERIALEAERVAADDTVRGSLALISPDWGEAELAAFGGLAADREQVRTLRHSREEAERASMTLQAELRRLERQREVLLEEEAAMQAGEEADGRERPMTPSAFGFLPRTKAELLQAWHQAEDARRAFERIVSAGGAGLPGRAVPSRSGREKGRGIPAWPVWLAAVLAILAFVWPFLPGQEERLSPVAFLFSAALLALAAGLAAYAWSRRGKEAAAQAPGNRGASPEAYLAGRSQVNEKLRLLLDGGEAAAAFLAEDSPEEGTEVPAEEADAHWHRLREAVHEQIGLWERSERAAARRQQLQGRMQELLKERNLIARDADEQRAGLEAADGQWREWLSTRRLPLHLTPGGASELFAAAERGQTALRHRKRLEERIDALDRAIGDFDRTAAALAEKWPPPAGLGSDVHLAVQWLYRETAGERSAKEAAERLEGQIAVALAKAQEAERELELASERAADMLREAGVRSESELAERIRVDERCRELRREAREMQLRLESGRDAAAQAELYELLGALDEASLAALVQERQARLAEVETSRAELLDRRGRLSQELERLRGEAEQEDKRQRLGELEDQLEALTERYAVLALADSLIVRTKAVYEQEKQPEVLLRASRYFRQMTDGAYSRIVAPGDSRTLLAETEGRAQLDSIYLSRGTQEQLYLAMRFALCDAASPEHPLPLLMDDLFVHFDETRLARTLPVLEELGGTRQVLMFTCHRHVAQTIVSGIAGASLLTLEA